MAEITITKHIEAPAEKVFSVATDVQNWPDYVSGIERTEVLTDGPVGLGTRFRETRVFFKKEATEEMEFTAFEPPLRYSLGCENHGCRYHTDFTLTPSGSGTDVEMRFQATPLTGFAKVMSFLMKPMMKSLVKTCAQDLEDLKTVAEA